MTQQELNREISRATGESITWIKDHGFNVIEVEPGNENGLEPSTESEVVYE